MNDMLFVYGSLLDDNNQFGRYVKLEATLIAPAGFKGRLYDCGEYPGAKADNSGYIIKGTIYRLNDPIIGLALLDDYEGFGDEQEQPNLFVRQMVVIEKGTLTINCWVYLYNLPTEGLTEITSGDYMAHLGAKKIPSQH